MSAAPSVQLSKITLTRAPALRAAFTNIQDQCVVHVAKNNVSGKARPTVIGDYVTVGHGGAFLQIALSAGLRLALTLSLAAAILHACTIEDGAFVGMGATIMDGSVIQRGAMVAAGALVTPGTTVPTGSIFGGSPAKLLRPMTSEEAAFIRKSAENYAALSETHARECDKSPEQLAAELQARKELAQADDDDFGLPIERSLAA